MPEGHSHGRSHHGLVHARDGAGLTRKTEDCRVACWGGRLSVALGRWPSGTPLVLATAPLPGASPEASGSSGDRQPTPALSRWLPMFGTLASRWAIQPLPLALSCNRDDCWLSLAEPGERGHARQFPFPRRAPRPPRRAIVTEDGVAAAVCAPRQEKRDQHRSAMIT